MNFQSRRAFLVGLTAPFLIQATSCQQNSPAEEVAKQFIEQYYVQMNPKAASNFTTGLAKETLTEDLKLMEGSAPEPASGKPRVHYQLNKKEQESPDEMSFFYEVKVEKRDLGPRKVYLKVRKNGDVWQVTQFKEEDLPPSSQP